MRTALIAYALLGVLLTSCESTSGSAAVDPQACGNRPAETAEAGPLAFGETFTYEDGLSLTVGRPAPFTPSDVAAGAEGSPAAARFIVTIVNGTAANVEPRPFYATVTSANVEGSEVFVGDLIGPPSTVLLPGREATFSIGFAVQDPADLVMEVNLDCAHDAAVYATTP